MNSLGRQMPGLILPHHRLATGCFRRALPGWLACALCFSSAGPEQDNRPMTFQKRSSIICISTGTVGTGKPGTARPHSRSHATFRAGRRRHQWTPCRMLCKGKQASKEEYLRGEKTGRDRSFRPFSPCSQKESALPAKKKPPTRAMERATSERVCLPE
jgi:hypothetical protein